MSEAFICSGLRTPFGRLNGSLSAVRTDDLAALPIAALLAQHPHIDPAAIDDVLLGCANQAGEDNRNVARMAALLAGLPVSVPGGTLNRLCGSGLDAVAMAARAIKSGDCQLIIAGGVENMSRAPYVMGKAETAFGRNQKIEDTTMGWRFINPAMKRRYGVETMPQTAENLASRFSISREDQDAFALRSQIRTAAAWDNGFYSSHVIPVTLPASRKQDPITFSRDEHPRQTTAEMLATLKPVVTEDGTVTAGNASGLNDGACALLIASADALHQHDLQPIARVIACSVSGIEPTVMGYGPVKAVQQVLSLTRLTLQQMDVIELNEAFAAQALSVSRALGLPDDAEWINPNGGAISLGHPLGASGGRLVINACEQLVRQQGRYALCTMCIGVGQGIAMIVERV
jgi:3-oxoadipyl-CoA thiolase